MTTNTIAKLSSSCRFLEAIEEAVDKEFVILLNPESRDSHPADCTDMSLDKG